jgi:hypothetical protein
VNGDLTLPSKWGCDIATKKNKKKGMVAIVPFYLREKTREEGDSNKAAVVFFFFLLQQNKTKRKGRHVATLALGSRRRQKGIARVRAKRKPGN